MKRGLTQSYDKVTSAFVVIQFISISFSSKFYSASEIEKSYQVLFFHSWQVVGSS